MWKLCNNGAQEYDENSFSVAKEFKLVDNRQINPEYKNDHLSFQITCNASSASYS
jgi:hypothetical protein